MKNVFHWGDLTIAQADQVFKIGTDAILLGAWAACEINFAEEILDAGTGTGIIALMMSKKFPSARIEGIDFNPLAVDVAAHNFLNADVTGRITASIYDIFSKAADRAGKFDVVICNPPFFQSPQQVADEHRKRSRHTEQNCSEWIKAFRFHLKNSGHVLIVIPSSMTCGWIEEANKEGLYCVGRMDVYASRHEPQPVRTLIHLHDQLVKPRINSMCIYDREGEYSPEYLALTSIQHGA